MTQPTEKFLSPDGRIRDSRQVSGLTRDRSNGTLTYMRSRKEQKRLLIESGAEFFRGGAKHRYVGFFGSTTLKRKLRKALQWRVLPYPKRNDAGLDDAA